MTGFFKIWLTLIIVIIIAILLLPALDTSITEFWKYQFFMTGTAILGVYLNYI